MSANENKTDQQQEDKFDYCNANNYMIFLRK